MSCFKKLSNIAEIPNFSSEHEENGFFEPKIISVSKPIENSITPHLWQQAILRSKIQTKYQVASLENCLLIPPGIVEIGNRWVRSSKKPSLYLHGNTGSGKTHFATSLYRYLVEKRYPWVVFVRSDDLDEELLNAIEEKQEKTRLTKYFEVPILFIDDLGVERPSDRMLRQYYSIIDRRVGNELVTIITSNVPKEKLPLGDRTKSRLEHFYTIEFPKKDLRKMLDLPPL